MSYLLASFTTHCKDNGIDLLKEDIQFIKNRLSSMTYDEQKKALKGYLKEWHECIEEVDKNHRASNLARYRANCYLRGLNGN